MKLSTLTNINTGILASIALALSVSVILGANQLEKPLEQTQQFAEYKDELNRNIIAKVNSYLRSGNSQLLTEAEQAIDKLNKQLESKSEHGLEAISLSLNDFKKFLSTDARAAGKLAGNEYGLLLQNEKETKDYLSSVLEYAAEGNSNNPQAAAEYVELAQQLLFLLQDRSFLRQQMLSAGSTDQTNIKALNTQMLNLVDELESLPKLGIFAEEDEEDDFADMLELDDSDSAEDAEDKAEEIISSLSSLIRRLPKEIDNSITIKKTIDGSYQSIHSHIDQIEELFEDKEHKIAQQFEKTVNNASRFMFVIISLIVVFSIVINSVQRNIARRIRNYVPYLKTFALGDFRKQVVIDAKTEEVKALRDSANTLRDNLGSLIGEVKSRSQEVQSIGMSVKGASDKVLNQMANQMESTLSITSSIEQMSLSIREVAQNALHTADKANNITESAQQSQQIISGATTEVKSLSTQVNQTSEEIAKLGELAAHINSVLEVINSIAEQTNLLALNAAIEAARAGENGRGFAVVADEVRSLSKRTSDSTFEIREIIENIQKQTTTCTDAMSAQVVLVDNTVAKSNQASEAVQSIVEAIGLVKDMTNQIATTTEEQASVAEHISNDVKLVQRSSNDTQQASQQSADFSNQLQQQSLSLLQSLKKFRFE